MRVTTTWPLIFISKIISSERFLKFWICSSDKIALSSITHVKFSSWLLIESLSSTLISKIPIYLIRSDKIPFNLHQNWNLHFNSQTFIHKNPNNSLHYVKNSPSVSSRIIHRLHATCQRFHHPKPTCCFPRFRTHGK